MQKVLLQLNTVLMVLFHSKCSFLHTDRIVCTCCLGGKLAGGKTHKAKSNNKVESSIAICSWPTET